MMKERHWKRVALLLPELDRGGPTLGAFALARGFAQSSKEVACYVIGQKNIASGDLLASLKSFATVTFFESSGWIRLPRAKKRLRKALERDNIDVLISFGLRPDILNRSMRNRVMSISSVRSLIQQEYTYRFGRLLGELWSGWHYHVLHKMAGVIVMTRVMRDALLQGGVSSEAMYLIDNVVDVDCVQRTLETQTGYTEACEPDAFHICVIASLIPRKRVADVIDAVARLCVSQRHPICLHIFGDGPERSALEQRVEDCGLASRVWFHGFCDDVLDALPTMSLCVLASGAEGMPRVILEAMALGKTCVIADYPGARDLVIDGVTGRLFPLGDVSALACIIESVIEHGTLPPDPILSVIRERFDVSVIASATSTMLDDLWNRHAS